MSVSSLEASCLEVRWVVFSSPAKASVICELEFVTDKPQDVCLMFLLPSHNGNNLF